MADDVKLVVGSEVSGALKGLADVKTGMDVLATTAKTTGGGLNKVTTGAGAASGGLAGLNTALKTAKDSAQATYGEIDKLAGSALKAGAAITGGLVVAAAALAKSGMGAAGQRQGDLLALEKVTGDAKLAAHEMEAVKKAAMDTAATIPGGLKLTMGLQAATITARESTDAIAIWANVVQRAGKGAESFDLVSMALVQMAGKAKLSGEEIRQLMEQSPEINKLVQAAFKTTDTEAIGKMGFTGAEAFRMITAEAAKLAKVGQTDLNRLDSVKQSLDELKIQVGKGIFEGGARAALDEFLKGLSGGESGAYKLGQSLAPVVVKLIELATWLSKNDGANAKWALGVVAVTGATLLAAGAITKLVILAKTLGVGVGTVTRLLYDLKTALDVAAAAGGGGALGLLKFGGAIALVVEGLKHGVPIWDWAKSTFGDFLGKLRGFGGIGRFIAGEIEIGVTAIKNLFPQLKAIDALRPLAEKLGLVAPKEAPAKPTTNPAFKGAAAGASARDDVQAAAVAARQNLESLEKLDEQRAKLLANQLDLVKAQGATWADQLALMDKLAAGEEARIAAKLKADGAAADKANDPIAKQAAAVEAEAARTKLSTDRLKAENEHAEKLLKSTLDTATAEKAITDAKLKSVESLTGSEREMRALRAQQAAEQEAIFAAQLAAAQLEAKSAGDAGILRRAQLDIERQRIDLVREAAEFERRLAEQHLNEARERLDAQRGVVQAQLDGADKLNTSEATLAKYRQQSRSVQEQIWAKELDLARIKRDSGQDAVAVEVKLAQIQAGRLSALAAEREAQRQAWERQWAAEDRLVRAQIERLKAQVEFDKQKGDKGAAARDQAALDALDARRQDAYVKAAPTLLERQARLEEVKAEGLNKQLGVLRDQERLQRGGSKGGGGGGESGLANAIIGGDPSRVADILARARAVQLGQPAGGTATDAGRDTPLLDAIARPKLGNVKKDLRDALQERDRAIWVMTTDALAGIR